MLGVFGRVDAQSHCSEENLAFGSQAQFEAFMASLGCQLDTIRGDLRFGPGITDLSPILGLRYIGGSLSLEYSRARTLDGLDSLRFVGHSVYIEGSVTDVSGLAQLKSVAANRTGNQAFPYGYGFHLKAAPPVIGRDCDGGAALDLSSLRGLDLNGHSLYLLLVGRCTDLTPLSDIIGVSSLQISAESTHWPEVLPYTSLEEVWIVNSPGLKRIDFFPNLRQVERLRISDCDSLTAVSFPSGLRFENPTGSAEFSFYRNPLLSTFDADLSEGPIKRDFKLAIFGAPGLRELRGLDELHFSAATVTGVGLETLELNADRRGSAVETTAEVVGMPDLRQLRLGPGFQQVNIAYNDSLEVVEGPGVPTEYTYLHVEHCAALRTIEPLRYLTSIKDSVGLLLLDELASFSFQPGDLDQFTGGGGVGFHNLASTRRTPTFPALKTLRRLGYWKANFDTIHINAPTAVITHGLTIYPPLDSQLGRVVRLDVSAPNLGRPTYNRVNVQHYSDRALAFDGLLIGFGYGGVQYSGLADCERIEYLNIWHTGPASVEPGPDFLPNLKSITRLAYDYIEHPRLFLPGGATRLSAPAANLREPKTFRIVWSPNLVDASAACPLLRTGGFESFDLYFVPAPFDTREGLLEYCDTVRTSGLTTVEAGPWRALRVSPTVSAAGADVRLSGLAFLAPRLQYRLVGANGAVLASGPLHHQQLDVATLTLPAALSSGEYWVYVIDERGGSATGVVVVH